jgi:hypothetical protein
MIDWDFDPLRAEKPIDGGRMLLQPGIRLRRGLERILKFFLNTLEPLVGRKRERPAQGALGRNSRQAAFLTTVEMTDEEVGGSTHRRFDGRVMDALPSLRVELL